MREFYLSIKDAVEADSSAGSLLKWLVVENGKEIYVKTSTYNTSNLKGTWMFESYSELIACRLFKELGLDNKEVVMYYPCKIHLDNGETTIGCYSYSFVGPDEKYISLANLHKCGKLRNYMFEGYNGYVNCINDIKQVINIEYKNELDRIITLDYLTLNEDRHTGNFGFIYNYKTKKFRIAPIFDNGASMFSTKFIEGMTYSTYLDNYVKSKPFYYKHEIQLDMLDKPFKLQYKEPVNTYKYISDLEKIGLNKERQEFIMQLISSRLNRLLHK